MTARDYSWFYFMYYYVGTSVLHIGAYCNWRQLYQVPFQFSFSAFYLSSCAHCNSKVILMCRICCDFFINVCLFRAIYNCFQWANPGTLSLIYASRCWAAYEVIARHDPHHNFPHWLHPLHSSHKQPLSFLFQESPSPNQIIWCSWRLLFFNVYSVYPVLHIVTLFLFFFAVVYLNDNNPSFCLLSTLQRLIFCRIIWDSLFSGTLQWSLRNKREVSTWMSRYSLSGPVYLNNTPVSPLSPPPFITVLRCLRQWGPCGREKSALCRQMNYATFFGSSSTVTFEAQSVYHNPALHTCRAFWTDSQIHGYRASYFIFYVRYCETNHYTVLKQPKIYWKTMSKINMFFKKWMNYSYLIIK